MVNMTHRELCIIAGNYIRSLKFGHSRCKYSVVELELIGESPDAFGWDSNATYLIEVKVSKSDFKADSKKFWRQYPEHGMGDYRYYLCPDGLISIDDLPAYWGLLVSDDKGNITKICDALKIKHDYRADLNAINSILRREGLKPQTFSYKKYKSEEQSSQKE